MTTEYFVDNIQIIRTELLDLVEIVGSAATLLREADDEEHRDNHSGALLCLDDALNFVSAIEAQASALAAKIAKLTLAVAA